MERGSAQHGARIDDELSHESDALLHGAPTPTREQEDLDPEALTADEENDLAARPSAVAAATDGEAPVHADLIARSELARWLLPSAFPASGATLAQVALGQGAPDGLPERLDAFGADPVFETVGELWVALGGAHEERASEEHEPEASDQDPAPEPEIAPTATDPLVLVDAPASGWADVSSLTPTLEDRAATVAGSIIRLVTLPPRVAIGVAHTVGGVVGRGVAALTASHRSSN